ncbi:MAG: universal stress protein [Synechococcales bacterium]|nr:universal stress protein [Synechococcales bacterium]
MFKHPLICTDLQDGLQRLIQFVPSLSAHGVEQVTLLHTVAISDEGGIARVDETQVNQVKAQLEAAKQALPQPERIQIVVQAGRAVDNVLSQVKVQHCDVVILGTASKNVLTETLFGSTTQEVARKIQVPLFILRPPIVQTYTVEELELRCQHLYRTLLIPYDGSDAAQYLVNFLIQKWQASPTIAPTIAPTIVPEKPHCILCWVSSEGGVVKQSAAEQMAIAQAALNPAKAKLEAAGVEVVLAIRQGSPIVEILATAQEHDISGIAIASNSLGTLIEWSVPSLTGELLRRSWYPVLFVPKGKNEESP